MARAMNSKIKRKSTIAIESNSNFDISNIMIDDQNCAYYDSLEKDMEKELMLQIAEIDRQTKLAQQLKEIELEKQKEIEIQKEKEQNQPSKEEMRQRRLKFYEK
jgi:hypothetical protein